MTAPTRPRLNPYLALTLTMAGWGSAFSLSEIAVDQVPHEVAALMRFGGGALILLLFLVISRRGAAVTNRHRLRAAGAGLVGVFVYNALFFWGLSLAPSLDGTIIVPVLSPVLTTAALVVAGTERSSAARLAGLTLGVAGAVVFFVGVAGAPSGGGTRLFGDVVYLLGAVAWATYTLLGRRVLAGIDPLPATTYGMLSGAIALALYAAPKFGQVHWSTLPASFWLDVAYLVTAPTALAYALYNVGVRAVGPSTASIMMFLVPVFGALGSYLLLGETIGLVQGFGALAMLGGALLAITHGRIRRRRPSTVEMSTVEMSTVEVSTVDARDTPPVPCRPGPTAVPDGTPEAHPAARPR
jgi:drug/metabolite transporter (DMT)-like permease